MAAAILYTNSDRVRAVLGLSDVELPDSVLENLDCYERLELDLEDVYEDHVALKATIDTGTPTTDELRTWKILVLYSSYRVATFCLPQLQLIVDKRRSDGDFEGDRFGTNLDKLSHDISAEADKLKALIDPDLVTFSVSPLSAVTPGYDPVTNEGS